MKQQLDLCQLKSRKKSEILILIKLFYIKIQIIIITMFFNYKSYFFSLFHPFLFQIEV